MGAPSNCTAKESCAFQMAVFLGFRPHLGAVLHLCDGVAQGRASPVRAAAASRASEDHDGEAEAGCPFQFDLPASHRTASLRAFEQLRSTNASDRYTKQKVSILVVGLSFYTAPIKLREKLAIPEAEWPRAVKELRSLIHIEEAAVLSTCNRTEVYVLALSWHMGFEEVTEWMSKVSGISMEELRAHLFVFHEEDAVRHLFRVSAGLDSLVLGEGQILSQVRQVLEVGQGDFGLGRTLTGLFKCSIQAGRHARSETSICSGAMSVSAAAVELAAMKLEDLQWSKVVIVGAGKMSRLLVKHLISKGCSNMVVVNRTEQRVNEMREEFSDKAIFEYKPLEEMHRCAGEAKVVFTCTASEQPLFLKEHVSKLSPAPGGGIRYFIDISVPRNVGTCVEEVPSVKLYNLDDLQDVVAANQEERRREAAKAEVIIEGELQSFQAWRDSLEAVPTIKRLRAYAERIRKSEVEKLFGKIGKDVPDKTKALIENMSKGLMNKYLDGPMRRLRCDGTDSHAISRTVENRHALERMFDLQTAEEE